MGFKYLMILLSLQTTFIIILCSRMVVVNGSFSRKESLKFDRKTNHHKNHAIFSIQSEDGDIIDCIDIYKQPAFDHPALRHHKIQMSPSQSKSHDVEMQTAADETSRGSPATVTSQIWHQNGSCPKGTIPVRRAKKNHPNYGRKKFVLFHQNGRANDSNELHFLRQNYSIAMLHTEGYAYIGAKGDIKVWNPNVEKDDEYSTSRVALKSGPFNDFEAIESGWQVNPSVYGDRQTRLFVYWTTDAAQKTGCFDLTCPGFIQTSNEIALGAAIYPISDPTGLPYQIIIYIHKDPSTSNWWLQYGEQINVGYWPRDLFDRLSIHAETAQWGGEVHSSRVGVHPHTATAMGSGQYPDFIWQSSGYVKRMRVLENSLVLRFPEWVMEYTDEYRCYDVYYIHDYVPDPEFYYGGPGRGYLCP